MKTHDLMHMHLYLSAQIWHGGQPFMHLHENHYIKRAGVAGIRERAVGLNGADHTNPEEPTGSRWA